MSDVLLFQTDDDGDMNIVDGFVELTDDFRTASYLSLFGGNEHDDGLENNPLTWWGNLTEIDPAFKYVSETEFLLRSLPVTTANLLKLEDAAGMDLNVFIEIGAVKEIEINIALIAINRLKYDITFDGDDTVTFLKHWQAMETL